MGSTEEPSASSKRRRKRRSRKSKKPEEPAEKVKDGNTVEAQPREAGAAGMPPEHAGVVAPAVEENDDVDLVVGDAAADPPRTPPKNTSVTPFLSPENLRLHDVAVGSAAKRDAAGSIRSAVTPWSQLSFTSQLPSLDSETERHMWTKRIFQEHEITEADKKRSRGKGGGPGKSSQR